MKYRILMAILATGLCAGVLADDETAYPHIAFVSPHSGKDPLPKDQFVLLVVEGPFISYEAQPIPSANAVDYINHLLKNKNVTYIGVRAREGIKYGDLVRAIDVLRKTNAKDIGLSMIELPLGREP